MIKKPSWLKVKLPSGDRYKHVKLLKNSLNLVTVCEEARCPNLEECWNEKHATFMLLGKECTRNCNFCSVGFNKHPLFKDNDEASRISLAVKELGLKYCVLTSVTRDDLDDGGALVFAETVKQIREKNPQTLIELLVPDFKGNKLNIDIVLNSNPSVIGHNLETSRQLHKRVRPQADYNLSLEVLRYFKEKNPSMVTKSSFMVGLGETNKDVKEMLVDLKTALVDIVYIGQYLQPARNSLKVSRYVESKLFNEYSSLGESIGIKTVKAGSLVRSSYRALSSYLKVTS